MTPGAATERTEMVNWMERAGSRNYHFDPDAGEPVFAFRYPPRVGSQYRIETVLPAGENTNIHYVKVVAMDNSKSVVRLARVDTGKEYRREYIITPKRYEDDG